MPSFKSLCCSLLHCPWILNNLILHFQVKLKFWSEIPVSSELSLIDEIIENVNEYTILYSFVGNSFVFSVAHQNQQSDWVSFTCAVIYASCRLKWIYYLSSSKCSLPHPCFSCSLLKISKQLHRFYCWRNQFQPHLPQVFKRLKWYYPYLAHLYT